MNVGTICYYHQKLSTKIYPKNVHSRKRILWDKKCPGEITTSVHKKSPSENVHKRDIQFWAYPMPRKISFDFEGPLLTRHSPPSPFCQSGLDGRAFRVEPQSASDFAIYFAKQTVWSPTNQKIYVVAKVESGLELSQLNSSPKV